VGIRDEDIAAVRAATDFVEVVSEHLALKRAGRRWVGLCPFHAEKSPSFSVNAEEGLYYCFGCQAKGDVITFVREVKHLDFVESVEFLAAKYGITLHYDDEKANRDRQRRNQLVDAMEAAVEWYHQRLLTGSDAGAARHYLRSRGYDGDLVRRFRIGWAPEGWDHLARALKLPDRVLLDTGLGFLNRSQRQTDAFRARVMFPIFDAAGRPVAFGGRRLEGGEGPKYKNSQETPLYSKSRTLYALNWSKTEIVSSGEAILCEGYTDVIGMFTAGLERAVATCGTAVTEEHVRTLTKTFSARRLVLAYDADSAGQAAAARFYEWEQRYEVDIAVAAFPPGSDPGDLARTDPDALREAVSGARSFLQFRLDRVLDQADLTGPEGRARAAESALAVVGEHPNELVRDQYLMQVSDRTRIPVDRLRAGPTRGRGRPADSDGRGDAANRPRRQGPEIEALRLAVTRPEEVAHRLEELLFADELHLAAFRALAEADTLHEAIESADPRAADLLQQLAVEDTDSNPDDVVARLAELAGRRVLDDLEAQVRLDPSRYRELSPSVAWLKVTMADLRESATRNDAATRLVAWLREGGGASQ
jgi:DNA primase